MQPNLSTHTCVACGHVFSGKYCNACGEKVHAEQDKKLSHVAEEAFHFITHLDGKFLRTLRIVFTKPGLYAKDYCEGKRKVYFKPVSLFLIVVVVYLLFPLLQGVNLPFVAHVRNNNAVGISYTKNWALRKMERQQLTEQQLAEQFDARSAKFAKVLLLVMLPLTALVLKGLFGRRRHYFYDHFILATELNTVFIALFFLILPLLFMGISRLFFINLSYGDEPLYLTVQALLFILIPLTSFRRFYGIGWGRAAISTVLFLIGYFIMIFIYRQLVFAVVMLSV